MKTIAYAAFLLAIPAAAYAQPLPQPLPPGPPPMPAETMLEVSATGETFAAPDLATIIGGVVTYAEGSREAAGLNADAMAKVVQALRAAGVARRDMQTDTLSLRPQTNNNRQDALPPQILGYQAQNSVTVRIRDIAKAPGLLSTMFEAGANSVNGPNFTLEDGDAAIAAARLDAVANARAEAQAYADAFGMRIARVIHISERGRMAQYNPVARARYAPPAPPAPAYSPPPVEPGEMRQSVTLWVDYALVPNWPPIGTAAR